ncbi:MAG TPA: hypothetical protein H9867_08920 [Candidatus Corynebacterium gallistercoris]|uniref:Uncharacterized protein n=1 Tax=Candidatus Corynebacterium gallistercoris TaxID=2838530 RepID=A0A9D1UQQ7_9CORY|nr:hypothetical protein [Candidatus Corynebacterium gallistercoris]
MSQTKPSTAAEERVAEFIETLRGMATGSYLAEEEKEFWEAPYPDQAVDEAQQLVTGMLHAAYAVRDKDEEARASIAEGVQLRQPVAANEAEEAEGDTAGGEDNTTLAIAAVITPDLNRLQELSKRYEDALIEDEEIADLAEIIGIVANDMGADAAALAAHVRGVVES